MRTISQKKYVFKVFEKQLKDFNYLHLDPEASNFWFQIQFLMDDILKAESLISKYFKYRAYPYGVFEIYGLK